MPPALPPRPIVVLTCLLAAVFAAAGHLFADTTLTSGTTTISTGTDFGANLLQIGVGGITGELTTTGWLLNDGTLVFNRSDASTYAGNFFGNGRLIKEGAGSLTVSGLVACWGGATIHSGTLALP